MATWDEDTTEPTLPQGSLRPLTHAERVETFGRFRFRPDPQPNDPEHIEILDGWYTGNIVPIVLPWEHGSIVHVHRYAVKPFLDLWEAWKAEGLLDRVSTVGVFSARYKRGRAGGEENLSSHAWGIAMDINARWNRLGHLPAQPGTKGCIIDLVPLAEAHGFAWGGNFRSRIDPMHFELARLTLHSPAIS
jgi:hypothetical protein